MADEENKEEVEAAAEQAAAPEAAEEAPAPEAEEAPEAEAEKAPEPAAAPAAAKPAGEDDDAGPVGPKQRRKRARSEHVGEPAEPSSGEERAAARAAARKQKAAQRSRYRAAKRTKKGEPRTGTPPAERDPGTQKVRQGIVTSAKADKTITVKVDSATRHPAYEKIIRRSRSLHAHDENNEAGAGDTVRVIETRPMSRSKRWRLVEVVEKAK